MHAVKIKIGGGLTILRCRRKHHLGVKCVITNLTRLVWKYLCERQDAKWEKHGQGLDCMMPNGRNTDGGINIPLARDLAYSRWATSF